MQMKIFYIQKVIEINEVDLDVVRSLNETSKLIKPPLKTRGVGSNFQKYCSSYCNYS